MSEVRLSRGVNHAQLRAFHAVASQGGFTKAAAALGLTQPTVSGQVRALEQTYGVRLFERRGHDIELTGLGRALHDTTRRLFGLEAEAEQLLAAARGLTTGHLRVGADAPYLVIPLLAAFRGRYPGIRLSLTFGNTERVLLDLFERRSDVALLPDIDSDERLHAVPYRRDRLIAFVDRGHPWGRRRSVRLAELAGQRVVLREVGSTTRALFERAVAAAGLALGDTLEIGSREGAREAVAAGLGIGVVYESEFGHDDRLHPLALRDAEVQSTECLACVQERRTLRVVRAFFDLVRERAEEA